MESNPPNSSKSSIREETQALTSKDEAPSSSAHQASQISKRNDEVDRAAPSLQTELNLEKVQKTPHPSSSPAKSIVQSVAASEHSQQKPYEAIRTNPLKSLDTRRRRLDRLPDELIPEVHIVGEIKYGVKLTHDLTEGAFCRCVL
jgi:hypothetical protein